MDNIQLNSQLSSQFGLSREETAKNLLFSVLDSSPIDFKSISPSIDVTELLKYLIVALRPYGQIRKEYIHADKWLDEWRAGASSIFPKGSISFDFSLFQHFLVSKAFETLFREKSFDDVKATVMAVRGCFSFLRKRSFGAFVSQSITDGVEGDLRWDTRDVIPCGRIWLCPVCRRYMLGIRGVEIIKATTQAVADDCRLYMLTLTAQHDLKTDIIKFRDKFQNAWKRFRNDRAFRQMWVDYGSPLSSDSPAMIENYETTFGERTGTHLHRHILFIVRKDIPDSFAERLKGVWVRCCANSGLKAVKEAISFEPMKDGTEYLSKLGWELTNSSYIKKGRGAGRMDYLTLCGYCLGVGSNGLDTESQIKRISWARKTLFEYVKMTYRLQCLHWSKGLKKRYQVKEVEDEDLMADSEKIERFFISRSAFVELNNDEKKNLLLDLMMGETDFSGLGLNLFCADGSVLSCGDPKGIERDKQCFEDSVVSHVEWCIQHGKKINSVLIPTYEKITGELLLLD